MPYSVMCQRWVQRRKFYEDGSPSRDYESVFEWKSVRPSFFKQIDAMRDFICFLEPSLASASDAQIRRHWPSFKKNYNVKIGKA